MFGAKKRKVSLRYGLQQLGTAFSGFLKAVFSRGAKKAAEADGAEKSPRRSSGEDRHEGRKPILNANTREGIFPRRYLLMAGVYLVTVVLLLSLVVLKWGRVPSPELPGFEREMEGALLEDELVQEELPSVEGNEKENGSRAEPGLKDESAEPDGSAARQTGTEEKIEEEGEDISAVQLLLPRAASPLPQWELYSPFGSYVTEKLPSGGSLHRMSRGAYLQAPSGTPVAALWDGVVVKVETKDGLYSNSVLLRHEEGHVSFYGNLREVWVEEGRQVSRGENIGILPYVSPAETGEKASSAEEPGPVPIKTIWKGYAGEEVIAQPEAGSDSAGNNFLPVWTDEGDPLLYLEVRLENNFLNPLTFIPARN